MAKIKKPTTKIVLRKDKVLSSGEYPVVLRITFNRKPKYYALKGDNGTLSAEVHKWNNEIGRYNRDKKSNQSLDRYEMKASEILKELELGDFTFSAFENRYFKKYETDNVTSFINHLIENLKKEERLGSANCYKDTRNRLGEFKANVFFKDINFFLMLDF